ncbi:MAG TPA: dTDP-4-dehydrorhamnose reductase, partial [Terriglobales bacterium]|nr:dTDP-4-dehydrorhamnose reductase [Terriglobales bacterium]
MRVTVFGASGLLGKALMSAWPGEQVSGLTSKEVDIREGPRVHEAIERLRPEWIVLAAAYTDVDGCESNADLAFSVNVAGTVNVAKAAQRFHARLLFLSSDYVFDGTKASPYETDDFPAPKTVYGRSKAEAEKRVLEILPRCCILRTSWLFGTGGKCFPETILRAAKTRPEVEVVNDQRGCPTYNKDLAETIIQLCRRQAEGIVHATNTGECTWFDFAVEILRSAGLNTIVRPTT